MTTRMPDWRSAHRWAIAGLAALALAAGAALAFGGHKTHSSDRAANWSAPRVAANWAHSPVRDPGVKQYANWS